jgi:ABC-2 type transport system ATP-binding protein
MNNSNESNNAGLVVEMLNVTKRFGPLLAVDDLSLSVPKGSIYGFIGPNGSGKTTTLRMIMNIFYQDAGTIKIFGENQSKFHTNRIGYLPEERGLYKKMKVKPLLRFYGSMKNGKNVDKEVDFWLEKFKLSDWADKKVQTLSKGMSQKVQFIAAVVSKPELLILDEPFSGLDPVNVNVIRDAVLELQSMGTTILFSTHDMNAAEKMCDFIFMIFKGKKVLDGTLNSIQDKYGKDTIRIQIDGDSSLLKNLNGIEYITNFGQLQELKIRSDIDPQGILKEIMSKTPVKKFEITKPSLHDIFIRIAGTKPETKERTNG